MGQRITRDAFLFLTPHSDAQKEDFAQCGPCRMFVPESHLKGKLDGSRCIIHGSKQDIDEDDSCGFMCPWPTPNGKPVTKVIDDHAAELLRIIPGSVTAEESGLVSRRVQCHRCRFAEESNARCGLYKILNKAFPEVFDLDEKITPNSCCNAQEPRTGNQFKGPLSMSKFIQKANEPKETKGLFVRQAERHGITRGNG